MGFLSTSSWSFCSSTMGELASPVHHSSTPGTAPFQPSSSFMPCPLSTCNSFWASRQDNGICRGSEVSNVRSWQNSWAVRQLEGVERAYCLRDTRDSSNVESMYRWDIDQSRASVLGVSPFFSRKGSKPTA